MTDKGQVEMQPTVAVATGTEAFIGFSCDSLTIWALSKRSLLLPVFFFLFGFVKSVCRCCTKTKKKKKANDGRQALHTPAGYCFVLVSRA